MKFRTVDVQLQIPGARWMWLATQSNCSTPKEEMQLGRRLDEPKIWPTYCGEYISTVAHNRPATIFLFKYIP